MPVSRDEVSWCYRLILGREPESEEAIQAHMLRDDRKSLLQEFLSSDEFVDSAASASFRRSEGTILSLPMDVESLHIDVDVTHRQLAGIIKRIKEAWEHLGITGAHNSVLTDPQFLPENLAESIDRFWASGVSEAEILKKTLARHGYAQITDKICVEYGCGVGRVTVPLAKACRHVHAYDISKAHLSLAETRASSEATNNVTFHLCSENLAEPLQKCDIFYSRLVFQHNPPPIIKLLIQQSLRSLRPKGIAVFQVPTYISNYRFRAAQYLQKNNVRDMEMHCLPQQVIFEIINNEECALLEVREDSSIGMPQSNTFVVKKLRDRSTPTKASNGLGILSRLRFGGDKSSSY
ncbi:MAG: methyltransferase type 12 [Nevskia sp.]|nr:methyltransferase type 12 [Nevskia sp.]